MENMIGDWTLVPELTTGHDDFAEAMGMTDEESEMTRNFDYSFHLSRDVGEWHIKVCHGQMGTLVDTKFQPNVPFTYMLPDQVTKLTDVVTEQNGHLIEKMTSDQGGVITQWDVDTYRDGDFLVMVQTKDGKSKTQKLRRQ
ncbi:uncharacterized protein LOC124257331 [Haliotis rubra]|uniref:uncharacterized protein LOC124257331 n=1 Tax=Haliotis rubra TaxID=36100 RepID=UPI001EE6251F|nr:uncharacterized protein LOC124257331 [Haliotis rubra]